MFERQVTPNEATYLLESSSNHEVHDGELSTDNARLATFLYCLNEFLVLFGSTIIFGTWPLIATQSLGLSLAQVAIVIAAWPVFALIVTPFLPASVLALGLLPAFVLGNAGAAMSDLCFMTSTSWIFMAICHGMRGACSSLAYNAITSYISGLLSKSEMCKCMAYSAAASQSGSLLGQALGGFMMTFSYRAPFILAASTTAASTVAVGVLIWHAPLPPKKEIVKEAEQQKSTLRNVPSWPLTPREGQLPLSPRAKIIGMMSAFNSSTFAILSALFVMGVAFDGVNTMASIVLADRFKQKAYMVSIMIAGLALCGIVINVSCAHTLKADQKELSKNLTYGLVVAAWAMVLFAPFWSSRHWPIVQYVSWVLAHSFGIFLVNVPRLPLMQLHFSPLGGVITDTYVPALNMFMYRVTQIVGPIVWVPCVTFLGEPAWAHAMAAFLIIFAVGLALSGAASRKCSCEIP